MRIWFSSHPSVREECRSAMLDGLRRAGVDAVSFGHNAGPVNGVVMTAEPDGACCELIRQATQGGNVRVLVVNFSASALTGEPTWNLLHAGAADIDHQHA